MRTIQSCDYFKDGDPRVGLDGVEFYEFRDNGNRVVARMYRSSASPFR